MMIFLKRFAISAVVIFVVAVLGLFAYNYYRRATTGNEPPVIYERADRPSRA